MGQWKRTLRNTGVSLTVAAVGILAAETAASAHDGATHAGDHVVGKVTGLGTDSFTITTHDGSTETIDTTSATAYAETGTTVPPTTVATGEEVLVSLDPSDSTPTALKVTVVLDRVSGKVTDVTSTSITLSGPRDSSRDVAVTAGTLYYDGTTSATAVTVGEFVTAFGTWDTTTPTELDAQFVDIGSKTLCTPRIPSTTAPGTTAGGDPSSGTSGGDPGVGSHPVGGPATAPRGAPGGVSGTASTAQATFHGPTAFTGSRATAPTAPTAPGGQGGGFGPGSGQGDHGFSGGGAGPGSRGGRG